MLGYNECLFYGKISKCETDDSDSMVSFFFKYIGIYRVDVRMKLTIVNR